MRLRWYLPKGLTFGPTNGPEDFQELVFLVFQRRLYIDWFLFLDDLTVATGRPSCLGPGPSGAADVTETNLTFTVVPEDKHNNKNKNTPSMIV